MAPPPTGSLSSRLLIAPVTRLVAGTPSDRSPRASDEVQSAVTLHPETTRADTARPQKAPPFQRIFRRLPAKVASLLVVRSRDSASNPAGVTNTQCLGEVVSPPSCS